MRPTALVLLSLCTWLSTALAAPTAPTVVSRDALFVRAFQSLPFLMTMASVDETFRKSLKPQELKMFQYIDTVAQDARNRQWFEANHVENFPQGKWDRRFYAPIPSGASPKPVIQIHSPIRFGLEFLRDRKAFVLPDGKPERTAETTRRLQDNIRINQILIEQPDTKTSYPEAVALMVHEMGHKLPDLELEEDAEAIDSLATKLRIFIENQMTSIVTSTGTIHILRFRNGPYDEWFEQNLTGVYQGVNIPFKFEPFRVFDNEGTIVFVENQLGIFDISADLFGPVMKENIIKGQRNDAYNWRDLNWILASSSDVRDLGNGQVLIDINMNHLQTSVPFMKTGAPDPAGYQPWKRAFPNSPPNVGRFERRQWVIDIHGKPEVKNVTVLPLVFEYPPTQVEKISVVWDGDDFVAKYRIAKLPEIIWEGGVYGVRPYLVVSANGQTLRIPSEHLAGAAAGDYVFRLKGARTKGTGALEVAGMELGPERHNLAQSVEPMIKLFLQAKETLPMAGAVPATPIQLTNLLAWNGTAWFDLLHAANAPLGITHLRFEFDSTAPLAAFRIKLNYNWVGVMSAQIEYAGQRAEEFKTGHITREVTKWIDIHPEDLQQRQAGSKLYVDMPVDKGILLEQVLKMPVRPEEKNAPPLTNHETTTLSVGARRTILALEYLNHSLQKGDSQFAHGLTIIKKPDCEKLLTD